MATLRQIATQVAYDLNRPNDQILIARVSDLVIQECAMFLRRSIERNGKDKALTLYYIDDLIKVDVSAVPNKIDVNQNVLRTENKVYVPLRIKSDNPFIYVGSVDYKKPIKFSPSYARLFDSFLPNVGYSPSYDYINGYIYLYNIKRMKYLAIGAIFENPEDVYRDLISYDTSNTNDFCLKDVALPIPMDIINDIKKSILQGELSVTDNKDKVESTHLDLN
jgi:hypothetical protein